MLLARPRWVAGPSYSTTTPFLLEFCRHSHLRCTTTTAAAATSKSDTTPHTSHKLGFGGGGQESTWRRACYFTPTTSSVTHHHPQPPSEEASTEEAAAFPTLSDILVVANERGVKLEVESFGPFFRISAWSVERKEEVGSANGMIRVWCEGRLLHLESIRMLKASQKMARIVFGLPLLMGAAAIRYAYDRNCVKAELLAIKDDHLTHAKSSPSSAWAFPQLAIYFSLHRLFRSATVDRSTIMASSPKRGDLYTIDSRLLHHRAPTAVYNSHHFRDRHSHSRLF